MIQTKIKFTIFDDGTKFLVQGKSPKMYLKTPKRNKDYWADSNWHRWYASDRKVLNWYCTVLSLKTETVMC